MNKRSHGWVIVAFTAVLFLSAGMAKAQVSPLTGDYFGSVAVTSPAGMGNIDIAFHLEVLTGGAIDYTKSYIILNKTLLFPKPATQVNGMDVGPMVQSGSTFTGTVMNLRVSPFTSTANGKTVTRTLTLTGTSPSVSGSMVTGTYTEVMTGYLPEPLRVTGDFTLVRPISIKPGAYACKALDLEPASVGVLTLNEIKAGGTTPDWVEFDDLSCAMYFYNNPGNGLTVTAATIESALANYKLFLQQ